MDAFDMLIAQHSVAGEVQTRPNPPLDLSESDDQNALAHYASDQTNLPWVIFRAAHRANHVSALPARARCVLAALARTVDAARPYAAIFARRELLTGRAMQSMRTFYRSLDDLDAAGFIVRQPQTRYGGAGLFGRAYIHLTPKAAGLLGLVANDDNAHSSVHAAQLPEQSASTANTISLVCPSVTVADGAIYKDLLPTSQKRQPGRIPADLERLRSLGFRDFLIFKLMREARLNAKKLSDVVEATWQHLRRASHPINYLRTLLRAPVDFAYRVRANHAAVTERTRKQARHDENLAAAHELAGQRFEGHDGLRQYVVSDDGTSIAVTHHGEARPRVHSGGWASDFIAALRAGHIRPLRECSPTAASLDGGLGSHVLGRSNTPSRLEALKQLLRTRHGTAAAVRIAPPRRHLPATVVMSSNTAKVDATLDKKRE
jgi:hypothetical protein